MYMSMYKYTYYMEIVYGVMDVNGDWWLVIEVTQHVLLDAFSLDDLMIEATT